MLAYDVSALRNYLIKNAWTNIYACFHRIVIIEAMYQISNKKNMSEIFIYSCIVI